MVSINMYSLIEQSLFITDGKSAAKYVKKVKEDGGQTNPEKGTFSFLFNFGYLLMGQMKPGFRWLSM
eukprot:m.30896 g.30896  ORF g.30896 m.30896 type:complete len:67 (-) comp8254_c0_seq4:743-943(-)